jgi:hypothetical protein
VPLLASQELLGVDKGALHPKLVGRQTVLLQRLRNGAVSAPAQRWAGVVCTSGSKRGWYTSPGCGEEAFVAGPAERPLLARARIRIIRISGRRDPFPRGGACFSGAPVERGASGAGRQA